MNPNDSAETMLENAIKTINKLKNLKKENQCLREILTRVLTGKIYIKTHLKEEEAEKWIDDGLRIRKDISPYQFMNRLPGDK